MPKQAANATATPREWYHRVNPVVQAVSQRRTERVCELIEKLLAAPTITDEIEVPYGSAFAVLRLTGAEAADVDAVKKDSLLPKMRSLVATGGFAWLFLLDSNDTYTDEENVFYLGILLTETPRFGCPADILRDYDLEEILPEAESDVTWKISAVGQATGPVASD